MTRHIDSLTEIAPEFGAIVLDQWGVLHDGTTAYGTAIETVAAIHASGTPVAILSNSGKRAAPNLARIAGMGFDAGHFAFVMSSGEALWQDIAAGRIASRSLFPIERAAGDAQAWAEGLDIALKSDIDAADAVLLMGLPDGVEEADFGALMDTAFARALPVYCTNPDRASPRAGGEVVISPGALGHAYADRGGEVVFYGKPHAPVFRSLEQALGTTNLLMVGDSLEHDIAGGHGAGWKTCFVRGGLHASHFGAGNPIDAALKALAADEGAPLPDFSIERL